MKKEYVSPVAVTIFMDVTPLMAGSYTLTPKKDVTVDDYDDDFVQQSRRTGNLWGDE